MMTTVQKLFSEKIKSGMSINEIAKEYSLVPAYVEREIKKIEDKKKDV